MPEYVANGRISELLLEHSPIAMAVLDSDMRYLACSRRWREDYDPADRNVTGRGRHDLFPEIADHWRPVHRQVMAGQNVSGDAELLMRANGSADWFEWQMLPWRAQSGEVGGAILILTRISDLIASRQRDETGPAISGSAADYAVSLHDAAGNVSFWSAGAEQMYGWSAAEMMGQFPAHVLLPDLPDATLAQDYLKKVVNEGGSRQKGLRVRKDGSRIMVDCSLTPMRDNTGAITGYICITRDIGHEVQSEHAIAAGEAQIRAILDTVPDAMITIDENGAIESFSKTAEEMFGYTADEVFGRNIAILMQEPDALLHPEFLKRYLATGNRIAVGNTRRFVGRRKDGTTFPHELYVGEATSNGRRIFTGFIRDLTQRDATQRYLRELQAELSHISRITAVETMATALAHEINQPLTAIANYVQGAAKFVSGTDHQPMDILRHALDEAGREAIRAGEIVRRLREFVSRGELNYEILDVASIVDQACSLGFIGCHWTNVICTSEVEEGIDAVFADRVEIQQILVNLIRNAVQVVGSGGRVLVRARTEGPSIKFSVIDNGPGVPLSAVESMFNPFVTSKAKGMGLGLAICRTLVELHGGRLWYEPTEGGGATFHFTLPNSEAPNA